jgi:type II secretory pathway pseudopilin PulG
MTRALRREGGFTLVELMLVCFISLIVFGATLTAWTSLYRSNRSVEQQSDNAESARVALDRAARQLRNLANPTVNAITTIKLADDYDFVFQTSDPNKTWVRYCLDTTGPNGATLWESENKSDVSGMLTGCPNTSWASYTAVAHGVTNQLGGLDRNVFTYECSVNAPTTCPASASEYSKITNVGMHLWVDSNVSDNVSELHVGSGVFLRNQNESPIAAVSTPQKLSASGLPRWILNGSGSSDPEGRTLEYFWFDDAPPSATEIASTPCTQEFAGTDWRGVTYIKKFLSSDVGQTKTFYLLVRDPGCLTSLSPAISLTVS